MGKKIKKNYPCTQAELYAVGAIAWESCREHLFPAGGETKSFSAFKAIYTDAYVNGKIQAIIGAEDLPDEDTRSDEHETQKILLGQKALECTTKWKGLKRYIEAAFTEEFWQTKLEAAGANFYEKAAHDNWEMVEALMNDGSNFIAANIQTLLANNNMPNVFQAEFDSLKTQFDVIYLLFKDKQQDAEEKAQAKIVANNAVYDDLTVMLKDGQFIFNANPALRERFVFAQVLHLVRGSANIFRTFILAIGETRVVPRVVANSKLTNTGDVILVYCFDKAVCSADMDHLLNPTDEALMGDHDEVTVTNASGDVGKFKVRITIH